MPGNTLGTNSFCLIPFLQQLFTVGIIFYVLRIILASRDGNHIQIMYTQSRVDWKDTEISNGATMIWEELLRT